MLVAVFLVGCLACPRDFLGTTFQRLWHSESITRRSVGESYAESSYDTSRRMLGKLRENADGR